MTFDLFLIILWKNRLPSLCRRSASDRMYVPPKGRSPLENPGLASTVSCTVVYSTSPSLLPDQRRDQFNRFVEHTSL